LQNFIKNNLCKVSRRRVRDRDRNPSRPRRDLRPSRPRSRFQKTGLETENKSRDSITGLHHRQTRSHGAEGWKGASEDNKWMIVQCAPFCKSLNPRNIDKSVSDIRIRIRFPFESSFWISLSGCKLTILPDIQAANRIVIISVLQ